jgi:hypothetical protein
MDLTPYLPLSKEIKGLVKKHQPLILVNSIKLKNT